MLPFQRIQVGAVEISGVTIESDIFLSTYTFVVIEFAIYANSYFTENFGRKIDVPPFSLKAF